MKRWSYWWLALALALLLPTGVSALALEDPPTIAPFKTARVRIEGTVSAQGQILPIQGEGEIDATRGASHLTIAVLSAAFETIVVDGRTYTHNILTGRWEYTEGTQTNGFNPARLAPYDPATIRAAGRNFTRVGPEAIGGVPATHWRADTDLNLLLGLGSAAPGSATPGQAATMDLWIGDADQRLYRLAVEAQTAAPSAAGTTTAPARQALTLTFDKFDADIAIIAPPGAVPGTPGTFGGAGALASPAIGAAVVATRVVAPSAAPLDTSAAPNRISSPASILLVRVLGVVSFAALGIAGLIALRHRRDREQRPSPDEE